MCLQGQRKTTRDFITTEELTRVDDGFGRAQTANEEQTAICNDVITCLNRPTRLALDLVLVEFF